jgi:hypothetical protein
MESQNQPKITKASLAYHFFAAIYLFFCTCINLLFIWPPTDLAVSEDASIEPWTVASARWLFDELIFWLNLSTIHFLY